MTAKKKKPAKNAAEKARKQAVAEIQQRLDEQDHEVPSAKEVANDANLGAYAVEIQQRGEAEPGKRGKKAASFRLEEAMQIGRADACHVKLSDTYVSQFHARVFPKDGAWFVEDLGSTNGTFLNQRKVTAPSELRGGDKLRMGKTMLELRS